MVPYSSAMLLNLLHLIYSLWNVLQLLWMLFWTLNHRLVGTCTCVPAYILWQTNRLRTLHYHLKQDSRVRPKSTTKDIFQSLHVLLCLYLQKSVHIVVVYFVRDLFFNCDHRLFHYLPTFIDKTVVCRESKLENQLMNWLLNISCRAASNSYFHYQ